MACGCSGTQIPEWEMQNICTLYDAAQYVKRKLGFGQVCVQITDAQLLDCCCQALRMAYRYMVGEATKRDYLVFKIIHGVQKYYADGVDKDGNPIEGNVFTLIRNEQGKLVEAPIDPKDWCMYVASWDFSIMNAFGGINTLHSAENLLLSDWALNLTRNNCGIVGYDAAMTFLKQVDNQFGAQFVAEMHEPSHTLTITPTPKYDCFGLLQIWKKTEVHDLLNNPLILDLMEAYAAMQVGRALAKYSITLAGGGTINGTDLYNQGATLYKDTLQAMKDEAGPPLFFVG